VRKKSLNSKETWGVMVSMVRGGCCSIYITSHCPLLLSPKSKVNIQAKDAKCNAKYIRSYFRISLCITYHRVLRKEEKKKNNGRVRTKVQSYFHIMA